MSGYLLQEPLRDELAGAITKARGGMGAGAMAYELLKCDKQSHHLIGVVGQGEKAVFYESGRWGVVAILFNESGVDGLGKSKMDQLKRRATAELFVRGKGEAFWTWGHPRYRWVCGFLDS